METFSVAFTAAEADALLKLIDLAVRGGGMQVAETAVILTNKVRVAAQAEMIQKTNGKEIADGTNPI